MKASSHWILQRISAIALIPLSFFTVYKMLTLFSGKESFFILLDSPFSLLIILLFILMSLYHASLGLEVIFEDYISCPLKMIILNASVKLLSIASVIFLGIALIYGYTKHSTSIEIDGGNNIIIEKDLIIEE